MLRNSSVTICPSWRQMRPRSRERSGALGPEIVTGLRPVMLDNADGPASPEHSSTHRKSKLSLVSSVIQMNPPDYRQLPGSEVRAAGSGNDIIKVHAH